MYTTSGDSPAAPDRRRRRPGWSSARAYDDLGRCDGKETQRGLDAAVRGIYRSIGGHRDRWAGSSWGFGLALLIVIVWGVTGPLFRWSDTWQLVINTGTTIVTFLMVFLVQRTQNKDGLAIQLKLNELVAAMQGASNRLIDIEDLSEEELKTLHTHYRRLVEMSRDDVDLRRRILSRKPRGGTRPRSWNGRRSRRAVEEPFDVVELRE